MIRIGGVIAALTALAVAGAITAGPGRASACTTKQAFAGFGDSAYYALFIGGNIEGDGAPWKATGSVSVSAENESHRIGNASDKSSLSLGKGSSASFHAGCLPQLNPSVRLMARAASGSGSLRIDVTYKDPNSVLHTVNLATLSAADYRDWAPTEALGFLNTDQSLSSQVSGNIELTLTASGGTWKIDDVYIDPYQRR